MFDADAALWPLASWAMDLHYVRGESFLSRFARHWPMTAQQAGRGEVHVLARPTPEAAPEIRGYDIAPDRLGLHQLIEPLFDVDTVDSARMASLKHEYRALKAKRRRSANDDRRLEALREQLADAPEWNGGAEAKAQTEALRSIQALIEKAGVAASEAPADKAPRVKPLRSKVGRKVVVE